MRKKGFTLIELLVVIAIIAILAAILFPVFAQAREKARAISCLSNDKQLANATYMYVQDYDEIFPFANDFGNPLYNIPGSPIQGRYKYWGDSLAPYIKNGGASGIGAGGTGNYGPAQRCPNEPSWYTGYAYNIQLGYFPGDQLGGGRTGPIYQGVSLAALTRPAELIVLLENSVPYSWMRNNLAYSHGSAYGLAYRWFPVDTNTCMTWYNWPDSASLAGTAGAGIVSGRHHLGANCVFADGHAKWLRTGAEICKVERGFP
jgi:prepilin-type N-terminal cleavage/methylation domain-containing protein/prepilin-type processing-associated H-X9-DG protein